MPAPTHLNFPRGLLLLIMAAVALALLTATDAEAEYVYTYDDYCNATCHAQNFRFAVLLGNNIAPGYTVGWNEDEICTFDRFFSCDAEGMHFRLVGPNKYMYELPELNVSDEASYSAMRIGSVTIDGAFVLGSLPHTWGRITSLIKISIINVVNMTSTLPPEWGDLANLQMLVLSWANVSGTIPASWGGMTSLKVVVLANTHVTGCLPTEWVCTANLTLNAVGLPASNECLSKADLCFPTTSTKSPAHSTLSSSPQWSILVAVTVGCVVLTLLLTVGLAVVKRCAARRYGLATTSASGKRVS